MYNGRFKLLGKTFIARIWKSDVRSTTSVRTTKNQICETEKTSEVDVVLFFFKNIDHRIIMNIKFCIVYVENAEYVSIN